MNANEDQKSEKDGTIVEENVKHFHMLWKRIHAVSSDPNQTHWNMISEIFGIIKELPINCTCRYHAKKTLLYLLNVNEDELNINYNIIENFKKFKIPD